MNLKELGLRCKKAWSQFAKKIQILIEESGPFLTNGKTKIVEFFKPRLTPLLWLAMILSVWLSYIYFSNVDFQKASVYRIAVDETWYPLDLLNKNENITGFSKDLTQAVANYQNLSIELMQVGSEHLFKGLDKGEYEAVLSSLRVIESRDANNAFSSSKVMNENEENYIFSIPYYTLGPVLVVPSSSSIRSPKDLNGKKIGILNEDEPISLLSRGATITFVYYDYKNRFKLSSDVINNSIDGMILDVVPASALIKEGGYENQLKILSMPLDSEAFRLIAINNPGSIKLINQFDEGLKAIKESSIYKELLLKWDLDTVRKKSK